MTRGGGGDFRGNGRGLKERERVSHLVIASHILGKNPLKHQSTSKVTIINLATLSVTFQPDEVQVRMRQIERKEIYL